MKLLVFPQEIFRNISLVHITRNAPPKKKVCHVFTAKLKQQELPTSKTLPELQNRKWNPKNATLKKRKKRNTSAKPAIFGIQFLAFGIHLKFLTTWWVPEVRAKVSEAWGNRGQGDVWLLYAFFSLYKHESYTLP